MDPIRPARVQSVRVWLVVIMKRIPYGSKVRIVGIKHESDLDMNGLTGTLERKFFTKDNSFRVFGEVGVFLDATLKGARLVNVLWGEVEKISQREMGGGHGIQ